MLSVLESIADVIINIVDFIISFFRNVVEIVTLVVQGSAYVLSIIVHLPLAYQLILSAAIAYSVIYVIVKFGG